MSPTKLLAAAAGAALALLGCAGSQATAKEAIDLDARLSQRIMREGATQRVFLRIAVKGRKSGTVESRTPLNVALVIDRSGSMRGEKMTKAREAAIMAVDRMASSDIASVIVFDDKIDVLQPARPTTSHSEVRDRISRIDARGSTAIWAAMQEAAREVRKNKSPSRLNRIILMSDGLANIGPSQPVEFERLGRELGGEGITVTAIGLGGGYNEDLMSRLANASDGNHAFASTGADLTRIFNQEFDEVLSVTAQDIEVLIETRAGVKPLRSLGRDSEIAGNRVKLKVAQAYGTAEYSLQVELEVPAELARGEADLANVRIAYTAGGSGERRTEELSVKGRFSSSDSEVSASIDPIVMAPIIELESRERTKKAVELRDQGRVEEARKAFEEDARKLSESKAMPGLAKSDAAKKRLDELEKRSAEAAREVGDEAKWASQRKVQRQGQSNSYSASPAAAPIIKY